MVLKAFKNFQMQHCKEMLNYIQYIKLIVHLSRHCCGAEEIFLEILRGG